MLVVSIRIFPDESAVMVMGVSTFCCILGLFISITVVDFAEKVFIAW